MAVLISRRSLLRAIMLGLALLAAARPARAAATPENQVKAVFLFNFAQFVEWPPMAFASDAAPLVIGVLGDNPFDSALEEAVRGENVNHRSLEVRHYRRVADVDTCHILFVARSEASRLDEIFAALKGRSILTVGDTDGFAQHGGMIRFVTDNSRVRLRINLTAAKAAGLVISSKLLRPAEIVSP